MHDVAVAGDLHELSDVHSARLAHFRQVVARQVNQHDVLGALFRIADEFFRKPAVFNLSIAAWPRTGNRVSEDLAVFHRHECFRRGADYAEGLAFGVFHLEQVHVRARVRAPQDTVDVESRSRGVAFEPLSRNHLKHVTAANVLFRGFNGREEVFVLRVGPHRRCRPIERRNDGFTPLIEVAQHGVDPLAAVLIGLFDALW